MRLATIAGSSPFASLRRNQPKAAKAADDQDDDKDKSKKVDDDGDDKDEDKEKSKSKKAADDGDDKDEDKEKSKSKKADDDGDDKDEDKEKSRSKKVDDDGDDEPDARAVAAIRASERNRVRTICESDAGRANPDAAYELAVNSDMATSNAIAMLKAVGPASSKSTRGNLNDRMSTTPQPDIGVDGGETPAPNDPKALANAIVLAGKKRRGEKID